MIPQGEAVELLVALIQNACVNDGTVGSGQEHRSVSTLESYFGRAGKIFEPAKGRQSVIYRVPGTKEGAPSLGLMGHLDVVPVNADTWSRDPFGGEIHNGFVWGRGTVDMLNLTSAMAAVFKRYLSGELPPLSGDLLYLAVADEEAGGEWGVEGIFDSEPEAIMCDYLLTEIAAPAISTPAGPAVPVTVAEKGPYWRKLATRGIPGHASQPYATVNALVPMAEAVERLAAAETPIEITPEWEAFVRGLDLAAEATEELLHPDLLDAAIERLAGDDVGYARWIHACTHMTVAPTVLRAGSKANIIADTAQAEIDIRTLPGQDEKSVDDHFRKVLGPALYEEIDIQPVMDFPSNSSPAEGPLWDAVAEAQHAVQGAGRLVPAMIPVTTDARFFRHRGTVAYGVGLFDDQVGFGDLLAMFHGNDERISVSSMRQTVDLFEQTVARFGDKTS